MEKEINQQNRKLFFATNLTSCGQPGAGNSVISKTSLSVSRILGWSHALEGFTLVETLLPASVCDSAVVNPLWVTRVSPRSSRWRASLWQRGKPFGTCQEPVSGGGCWGLFASAMVLHCRQAAEFISLPRYSLGITFLSS